MKAMAGNRVDKILKYYSNPYELYKEYYDDSDCGVSIGMKLANGVVVWNDDLPHSWNNLSITHILVMSIVEGIEQTTDTYEIPVGRSMKKKLDETIESIENEVNDILAENDIFEE